MPTTAEIEAKFWKSLKSDMTLMLGLAGSEEAHAQPMTAQLEAAERGPIWFFTSTETDLAQVLGDRHDAVGQFASKGHDLFATINGVLRREDDRANIDRLWNPFVAAWFEGGKTDPKLLLLDEVMAGLNPSEIDQAVALVGKLSGRGLTIVIVEHVMRAIMAVAKHIVVLDHGQKIAEGSPKEIVENPEVIRAYLGTAQ